MWACSRAPSSVVALRLLSFYDPCTLTVQNRLVSVIPLLLSSSIKLSHPACLQSRYLFLKRSGQTSAFVTCRGSARSIQSCHRTRHLEAILPSLGIKQYDPRCAVPHP